MSMNDTRERLQIFFKAADEANTLLDMWIGVFAQAEYTQRLLLDPTWEGPQREEEHERELQRQRSAYQQALEEDIRQENLNIQSQYNNNASGSNNWNSSSSVNHPAKSTKTHVSTVSSTRAQTGAAAANRKRGATNTNARARR
ncbi:hypothetical protein BGZ51_007163 [Haplosporangium sp. Z 767]|nr:hypothetical protein BGZ51_007163 [Haplosporangium sp. Z 767]